MRYRHLRRTLIAALIGAAALAGLVVAAQKALETSAVRRILILRLERWIGDATGSDVNLGTARLSLFPAGLELERLELVFPTWNLSIRRLTVEGALFRPMRARLDLGLVHAEGVLVRAASTTSPAPRPDRTEGWLRLHVRQLSLQDVSVENLQLPGDIRLTAEPVELAWSSAGGTPRGFARIPSFRLDVPGIEPVSGSLMARLRIEDGIEVPHLVLRTPAVSFQGRGLVHSGGLRLALTGSTRLEELDRILHIGEVLTGEANMDVRVDTLADPPVRAKLSSPRLVAAGFPMTAVRGTIRLKSDGISGQLEHAGYRGGVVSGEYRLAGLSPPWAHQVEARGSGISLAGFLTDLHVPDAGLAGTASLEASLQWNGRGIKQGSGEGTARFSAAEVGIPVEGTLLARLAEPGVIQFDGRGLKLGSGSVDWQGPLTLGDWVPSWSLAVTTNSLGELVNPVNTWVGSTVLPDELSGAGTLHVTLSGPWKRLQVGLQAELAPLELKPLALDRAVVSASIAGARLDIERGVFTVGDGGGRVEGSIRWDRPDEQLDLHFAGRDIPLATVAQWLDSPVVVRGSAGFSGSLHGPVAGPVGSFALGLVDVAAAGIPIGNGSTRVELSDATFTARALQFEGGPQGEAAWNVADRRVLATVRWPNFELERIHPAVELLAGHIGDVTARLDWPLDGVAELDGHVTSSLAALNLHLGQSGVGLDVTLGKAAQGRLNLARDASGLHGSGQFEIQQAGELLERLLPGRGIPLSGEASATLDVDWPTDGTPSVHGSLTHAELELDRRPLRLLEPAAFHADAQEVAIEGLHATVGKDEVFLRVSRGSDGALAGNLSGTLDALLLRLVLPQWEPAGRLEGVVELLGTDSEPRLEGLVEVHQGSFRLPDSALVIGSIDGAVELGDGAAVLSRIDFRVLGGVASCTGSIRLGGEGPQLALEGSVKGARYTVLPGMEARLSGNWWLRGPARDLELGGRLTVERAALRRREDVASILMDWFGSDARTSGGSDLPRLEFHVEADRTIEARTPFAHLAASAVLDISGTPAHPGLVGRIEFMEGGDVILRGVRYELDRGVVTFTDPSTVDAHIDLQARAWVDVYTVTVMLQGTPDRLVPTLSSDPPLQEADILSLLSLGHRGSREDEGMGAVLASTILTSQINAELERRARSILAVDQLRVDPFSESSTGNPTARVTLVKQLAPNWTVVVQSNLSSNREEVVISRWYLTRGVFLEATRDTDGSYSLDLKLRQRY